MAFTKEQIVYIAKAFNKTESAGSLSKKYGMPEGGIHALVTRMRATGIKVLYKRTPSRVLQDAFAELKKEKK